MGRGSDCLSLMVACIVLLGIMSGFLREVTLVQHQLDSFKFNVRNASQLFYLLVHWI